ncbi:MAG: late competence development ComFB family protein [Oscillospiraceae bacterium]
MAMVNLMEQIVWDKLDHMLEDCDCCKCDICRNDMAAYALNSLRPKYVNTQEGELFGRLDTTRYQNSIDIDVAVSKAIAIVSASPRHK